MTKNETEALRKELLDEIYAAAFAGMAASLEDEDEILNATPEELERISWRFR